MNSILKIYLKKTQEENAKNSVGSICDRCYVSAYYFKEINTDLYIEKTCLICSENM